MPGDRMIHWSLDWFSDIHQGILHLSYLVSKIPLFSLAVPFPSHTKKEAQQLPPAAERGCDCALSSITSAMLDQPSPAPRPTVGTQKSCGCKPPRCPSGLSLLRARAMQTALPTDSFFSPLLCSHSYQQIHLHLKNFALYLTSGITSLKVSDLLIRSDTFCFVSLLHWDQPQKRFFTSVSLALQL